MRRNDKKRDVMTMESDAERDGGAASASIFQRHAARRDALLKHESAGGGFRDFVEPSVSTDGEEKASASIGNRRLVEHESDEVGFRDFVEPFVSTDGEEKASASIRNRRLVKARIRRRRI
jgi:hypothetical protein